MYLKKIQLRKSVGSILSAVSNFIKNKYLRDKKQNLTLTLRFIP